MGRDGRRRRSRSHHHSSEPTSSNSGGFQDSENIRESSRSPCHRESGPGRKTFQNSGSNDQVTNETRSPRSCPGNSDSRERRRRKKRLRSESHEQRSRWAILIKVFVNSQKHFFLFNKTSWSVLFVGSDQEYSVFQLMRTKIWWMTTIGEPRLFGCSRLRIVCGIARAMPKYLVGGLSNQVLTCHWHPCKEFQSHHIYQCHHLRRDHHRISSPHLFFFTSKY